MKLHWLRLSLLATLIAWVAPATASAAWRDRVERREARYEARYQDRNEDRSAARAPAAPPRGTYWNGRSYVPLPPAPAGTVDRLLFATPREREYYRRYGWPAEPPRGATVYRPQSPSSEPRNYVERSARPMPALREPTLAIDSAGGVEQASATESLPQPGREPTPAFDAQPPAELPENLESGQQWPQLRQAENARWREARIKELEARIEALEAAQTEQKSAPPLPGPAD